MARERLLKEHGINDMIIVNEIQDPRFLENASKYVDYYYKQRSLIAGISNGFVTDIGINYVIATFVCRVYSKDEPKGSQECDFKLIQVRLTGLKVDYIVELDSLFF
jgi:hypothetical protein